MSKASPELLEERRLAKEKSQESNAIADEELSVSETDKPGTAAEQGKTTSESVKTVTIAPDKAKLWLQHIPSLSGGILGYGILVLLITAFLIYRGKARSPAGDGQWLIRTLVIPMCVIAAVFLTVVGYDSKQMSPVIGLLGTIIGYLLGSGSRANVPVPPDDSNRSGN